MPDENASFHKRSGSFEESVVAGEKVQAFVPFALPPELSQYLSSLLPYLTKAQHALGKLDGISHLLKSPELFLYMYVRKEAVLSSQIEGTQSTLTDLLRHEAGGIDAPLNSATEVSHYVQALEYGREQLEKFPLSLRLLRQIHKILLQDGRGYSKDPGNFRTSQNWIGGTRPGNALFVPPPPLQMKECLYRWENFIHEEETNLPPLIKAGLLHVQFETIHPFLDGNGRLGRLFIPLYLTSKNILNQPLLYLSLYFKQNRKDYYRLLQEVREYGAWQAWLEFFLEGVKRTADSAVHTASEIRQLFETDHNTIITSNKRANTLLKIYQTLQKHPFLTIKEAAKKSSLSLPATTKALLTLEKIGIIEEVTGQARNRVFAYKKYVDLLSAGTELNDEKTEENTAQTHSIEPS